MESSPTCFSSFFGVNVGKYFSIMEQFLMVGDVYGDLSAQKSNQKSDGDVCR